MSNCKYCGGDCPNQEEYMCDGYSGDIDNLYGDEDGEFIFELTEIGQRVVDDLFNSGSE